MNSPPTLRRGTLADAPLLAGFNRAMARESEGVEIPEPVALAGVEGLFARPDHGFYLVAEAAGGLVGSLMVTPEWSDWRNGFFWWVQSVYVLPEHRRRGVYRALYEQVLGEARAQAAVCGVRLYVERENTSARRVYARLGMQETPYRLYETAFPAASNEREASGPAEGPEDAPEDDGPDRG